VFFVLFEEFTMKAVPFARFGLTEEEFQGLVQLHLDLNDANPQVRSSKDLPFYDWEAQSLQRLFEAFKDDSVTCSLVAAMMKLVHDDVERRRAEKEAADKVKGRKDKQPRANTIGMFWAPSATLAEQSNAAST
jgi:hypothetical protein